MDGKLSDSTKLKCHRIAFKRAKEIAKMDIEHITDIGELEKQLKIWQEKSKIVGSTHETVAHCEIIYEKIKEIKEHK